MSNYGYARLVVQEPISVNSISLNSSSSGSISIIPPATSTSYNLILPSTLPNSQQALFVDTLGNVSFKPTQSLTLFSAQQNISTAQAISGISFTTKFSYDINVIITASTNLGSLVTVSGVLNGANQWLITQQYLGDNTGILFSIQSGTLYYTSPSFTGWVSTVFNYY